MTSTDFTKTAASANTASSAEEPGIRCMCPNFRIILRPADDLSDANPLLATHLKYCPAARRDLLPRIVENLSGGTAAFIIMMLVIGWSIHEHGWPWIGR